MAPRLRWFEMQVCLQNARLSCWMQIHKRDNDDILRNKAYAVRLFAFEIYQGEMRAKWTSKECCQGALSWGRAQAQQTHPKFAATYSSKRPVLMVKTFHSSWKYGFHGTNILPWWKKRLRMKTKRINIIRNKEQIPWIVKRSQALQTDVSKGKPSHPRRQLKTCSYENWYPPR